MDVTFVESRREHRSHVPSGFTDVIGGKLVLLLVFPLPLSPYLLENPRFHSLSLSFSHVSVIYTFTPDVSTFVLARCKWCYVVCGEKEEKGAAAGVSFRFISSNETKLLAED